MPDVFYRAIRRIMATAPGRVRQLPDCPEDPASHGWLRRSELDRDGCVGWELPSGEVRLTAPAETPAVAADPAQGR